MADVNGLPKIFGIKNVIVIHEHEELASRFTHATQARRRKSQLAFYDVPRMRVPRKIPVTG